MVSHVCVLEAAIVSGLLVFIQLLIKLEKFRNSFMCSYAQWSKNHYYALIRDQAGLQRGRDPVKITHAALAGLRQNPSP